MRLYKLAKKARHRVNGLIIKEKWLDLILSGIKDWEIRGSKTSKRETIYLIQSGSSKIMGQVDLIGCMKLTEETYEKSRNRHCIEASYDNLPYNTSYAWLLNNPVRYEKPIPYIHPQGAVIWVKGL